MKTHSRRIFLKTMGIGMAASIPAGLYSKKDSRPNIILIMSDDMGFSDIGCYGSEIKTPVLDKLASKGLRFTQFYNTGRCCPTRACLLTGLYPHQAGVGHMMQDKGLDGYKGNLNKNCVTIAEALKPTGYSTYISGKWHVTKDTKPETDADKHNWPLQRGFDRFYGTIHGAGSFWDPNSLTRGNTYISPYADPEYKPKTFFYTDAISDHAAKFIRENSKDKPFFMYVAYTAAHWPMHALPKDIAKYKGKYDKGWDALRKERHERMIKMGLVDKKWKMSERDSGIPAWKDEELKEWNAKCMEVYAAMIDNMDQGIGKIVNELKKTKKLDNTLVLFFQDNGGCAEGYGRRAKKAPTENLGAMSPEELQHDMTPKKTRDGKPMRVGPGVMPGPADTAIGYGKGWANVSDTPFRKYKHYVHEGGISTPLIAHWPDKIKGKGDFIKTPSHLVDLMPTCVELAKAKYPKEYKGNKIKPMEGRSLVPAFNKKPIKREAIYWEHEGNRAIRIKNWKLVASGGKADIEINKWELYDIDKDRGEMNDLSNEQPERKKKMYEMWRKYAKRANVIPWPAGKKKKPKNKKGKKKKK